MQTARLSLSVQGNYLELLELRRNATDINIIIAMPSLGTCLSF